MGQRLRKDSAGERFPVAGTANTSGWPCSKPPADRPPRGLTSPDPVTAPYGPSGPPEPRSRARNPGQAAEQASGGKPTP